MGKTFTEKIKFISYAALFSIVFVIATNLFTTTLISILAWENLLLIGISEKYFEGTLKILSSTAFMIFVVIMLLLYPDYLKDEIKVDTKKMGWIGCI